ncbi:ADP-ribosylglycohydrolase family protein [Paenibacillus polymyxa]
MGTCVGDALGVPVEFVNRNLLTAKPIIGMIGHGTWDHPPGT